MCYTVPLTGAIITTILGARNKSPKLWSLNLMFYGGAIFGVIDHWWNGELFLISKNWLSDLVLGVVITMVILIFWLGISAVDKLKIKRNSEKILIP